MAQILRSHYFNANILIDAIKTSKMLFKDLYENFGSNRVAVIESVKLPMFPIILIDDILIIVFTHIQNSKHPKACG